MKTIVTQTRHHKTNTKLANTKCDDKQYGQHFSIVVIEISSKGAIFSNH